MAAEFIYTCYKLARFYPPDRTVLEDISLSFYPGAKIGVIGSNGSGKSSLYRSLRLLYEVAQGRAIASLAAEGGLTSTLWAGPETNSRQMRAGKVLVQGTVRNGPVSLKLGFSSEDYGYAIDLGLPIPSETRFGNDPEIKAEAVWTGPVLGSANLLADRRGSFVRIRSNESGAWRDSFRETSALP
jgi:predicted ATPase